MNSGVLEWLNEYITFTSLNTIELVQIIYCDLLIFHVKGFTYKCNVECNVVIFLMKTC